MVLDLNVAELIALRIILSKESLSSELRPASVVPFGDLIFATVSLNSSSESNESKDLISSLIILFASLRSRPEAAAASTIFDESSKYQAGPLP
mgnify:CR=1 FL=1